MVCKRRTAQGFTLLEVLVAMVVLSIGLLGLSGLQTTGLRNNHSAFLRSQATLMTTDILDRMRSNWKVARSGSYNLSYGTTPTKVTCIGGCTPQQVAQNDVYLWHAYVQRLPGGEGRITVNATTHIAEVEVCWGDVRGASITCTNAGTDKLKLATRSQI